MNQLFHEDYKPGAMASAGQLDRLLLEARKGGGGVRKIIARAMTLSGGHADPTDLRLRLERTGTTENWGEEPWTRTAPDALCPSCGKEHRQHLQECGPGYGACGDLVLFLHRLCSGALVKL
jgi:hypothetical protein